MDTNFSAWHNGLSTEEKDAWSKRDEVNFDKHTIDKLGTPREYIESCGIFSPNPNADYGLCRFYEVGSKSPPPHIPDPQKPVTCSQLLCLLKKGWKANRPYLLVATSQDIITPSSLLEELPALAVHENAR